MRDLDLKILADLSTAGLTSDQIAAAFAAFERRRGADFVARHRVRKLVKQGRTPREAMEPGTRFDPAAQPSQVPEPMRSTIAINLGIISTEVPVIYGNFSDYYTGVAGDRRSVNWLSTWRAWCRTHADYQKKKNANKAARPGDDYWSDEKHNARMASYGARR
ncbi:MAG TPA: hypothetical protein VGF90_06365 [Verrucomicrobiae bacterium]|jgi:hypothetical protein